MSPPHQLRGPIGSHRQSIVDDPSQTEGTGEVELRDWFNDWDGGGVGPAHDVLPVEPEVAVVFFLLGHLTVYGTHEETWLVGGGGSGEGVEGEDEKGEYEGFESHGWRLRKSEKFVISCNYNKNGMKRVRRKSGIYKKKREGVGVGLGIFANEMLQLQY